jgi:hypothetical protein
MFARFWHTLLCSLGVRNALDYTPPAWPEVKHPYYRADALQCCRHCGGGPLNAIHSRPFDERRAAEVERIEAGQPEILVEGYGLTIREDKSTGQVFTHNWGVRDPGPEF